MSDPMEHEMQKLFAMVFFSGNTDCGPEENISDPEGAAVALRRAGFVDVVELPLDPKAPFFQAGDRAFEAAMVSALTEDAVFDLAHEIAWEYGGECQEINDTSLLESAAAIH